MIELVTEDGEVIANLTEDAAHRLMVQRSATLVHTSVGRVLMVRRAKETEFLEWWLGRPEPSPFALVALQERKALVRDVTDSLDDDKQDLVRLRYARDLTFGQIAAVFEVTEEAVIQMHWRVMETMRRGFEVRGVRRLQEIL